MTAGITFLNAAAGAAYLGVAADALRRAPRSVPALAVAGAAVHAAGLALAWREAGHGPFLSAFEVLSAKAFLLAATTIALAVKDRRLAALGRLAFPLCAALIAVAIAAGPRPLPVPVAMRSVWLAPHEVASDLAFVALALAAALAIFQARGAHDLAGVDARRWAGVGLALWTTGMLLGSIWGHDVGGRFWRWGPVETWAFAAWLVLGANVVALRRFAPGARARAWLQGGAFAVAAFAELAAPRLAGLTEVAISIP